VDQTAVNDYLARIRAAKTATLPVCPLVTDAFIAAPPYAVGVSHLILRPRFLLADPAGTGKTPQALVAYAYLKHKNRDLKAVVHTTQAAQFQWADRVEQFLTGVKASVVGYERTHSGGWESLGVKGRAQQWAQLQAESDVWITTYALGTKEEAAFTQHLLQYIAIFDEAHVLRSHRGEAIYPAMQRRSTGARGTWALTATPLMDGRVDELYAVMEAIRPGTFGDYPQFKKTYHQLVLIKPKWKVKGTQKNARPFYKTTGFQNLPLLRSQIEPFYLKRPAEEMNQFLPPVRYQQRDLTLDPRQRSLYNDIRAQHWPGATTKFHQLAALTYAQMAADAPAVLGYPTIPSVKTAELIRLLENQFTDQKVLVFAKFEKVVSYLSVQLTKSGIAHGVIAGHVSAPAREAIRQRFQTDPAARVVLLTTAGAQALDLQAAGVVICYDLPWTPGELEQIVGRARRVGSEHESILVVLLAALHTIDTKVIRTLTVKETRTRSLVPGYSPHDTTLDQRSVYKSERGKHLDTLPLSVLDADPVTVAVPDDLGDLFTAVGAD